MYTLIETPAEFEKIKAEASKNLRELLSRVRPVNENITISSNNNLVQICVQGKKFLLLKGGLLSYAQNNKVIFFYEEGDLIGVDQLIGLEGGNISSEFAVTVDEYLAEDVFKIICQDSSLFTLWTKYLVNQMACYQLLISSLVADEANSYPALKNFQKGETIILQGSEAAEVFTLVQGSAEVYVDQVKVGNILPDETFGVISAITGAPRNATVIAAEDSMVVVLPKEKLISLIKARPESVIKLVEDMARVIGNLNKKVVELWDIF